MKTTAALTLSILLLAPAIRAASDGWPIDKAHSRITFTVTKWGFAEVEGRFYDFEGTLAFDEQHPELSRVDWRVRADSIKTGEAKRDQSTGVGIFRCGEMPRNPFRLRACGSARQSTIRRARADDNSL